MTKASDPRPDLPGSQPDWSKVDPNDPNAPKRPDGPTEVDDQTPAPADVADEPIQAAGDKESPAPDVPKARMFQDSARNAIAAKRAGMTLEERQQFAKEDPVEYTLAQELAGQPVTAEDDVQVDPVPAAPTGEDGTPAPAPAAAPAAAPVATNSKTRTIKVYGQEKTVSEDEVIQAGIRTLQLETAADTRMTQAATREAQLVEWEGQLQKFANNLANGLDQEGRPINPTGGPGQPAATPTGVAGTIDREKLRKAQAALLSGNDDESADIMADIISSAVAATRPAAAPAPAKIEVPARPAGVGDPWGEPQRVEANKFFEREYLDLSDDQFRLAQAQMQTLMANPSNRGKPLVELARAAGETVRQALGVRPSTPTPAPAAPASPAAPSMEDRRTLKARLPVTPPLAGIRAPAPAPAQKTYPTAREYVQQLQARSGSNSAPRLPTRR